MAKEVSEEVQRLLLEVAEVFDREDRPVRERQVRVWKKLKYYWDGIQRIWWDEVAHDWRTYDLAVQSGQIQDQQGYYDKPVNVFRAYLESIIAALSVVVPPVKCYPDDANNVLDLQTARAGDKIGELVYRHNDAVLLWLHALYIFCTEGMIAAYHYSKEDKAYGTYQKKEYEDVTEEVEVEVCDICGTEAVDQPLLDRMENEFAPGEEEIFQDSLLNEGIKFCPTCAATVVNPQLQKKPIIVTRLIGMSDEPKSRQCIEVHGGLFVKVALYAQSQADTPYLQYAYETHYSNVLEKYPHLREKINPNSQGNQKGSNTVAGNYDPYERWARQSTQYRGEFPLNTPTVKCTWLRPCAFNVLQNEANVEKLKKLYPSGVKVVTVAGEFAEACNEALDDYWTLTHNPLSDYLHHDPYGLLVTSVQDITNELLSLIIQTIEHGITQTFADAGVLDLDAYQQVEASPGSILAIKAKSGQGLGESFFQLKAANLSAEVLPFADKVNELGQFASGALPALFGGAMPSNSKTAAQFSMSRSQAMQRLQTPWKMLTIWWKNIFGKVIPAYIQDVVEDEHYVTTDKSVGNFVNVFIRTAELQGKIGRIELDAHEQLPLTWAQQKDIYMQLMQASNPILMQALTSPENVHYLKEAIGLSQFVVPGESDREKQLEEIKVLVETQPIMEPMSIGPDGTPIPERETPSVDIEPLVDENQIHSEICRGWLVSEEGRLCKVENPLGYKNVLLHKIRHDEMMAIQAQQMMAMQQPNAAGGARPKGPADQNKPMAAQVRQHASSLS